jgi:hypothetical protein
MKLLTRDVSVIHIVPYGGVECSAIVGDTYYHRRYIDYSTRDALRLFREYVQTEKGKYVREVRAT